MNVDYLKILLSLLFVLALIVPIIWLLKHIGKSNFSSAKTIKILEKFPVAQGAYLAIAYIVGKFYLLSISNGGVSILKTFDSQEEILELKKVYGVQREFDEILLEKARTNTSQQDVGDVHKYLLDQDPEDKDILLRKVALKKDILNNVDKLLIRDKN